MESAFYKEFPKVTKQDWLEKIKSDLKGKAPEDFYQQITEDWGFSPFLTKEDIDNSTVIQKYYTSPLLAQTFDANDGDLKEKVLHSLEVGLQSPFFTKVDSISKLTNDLQEVNWEMISPAFELTKEVDPNEIGKSLPDTKDVFITQSPSNSQISAPGNARTLHFHLKHTSKEKIPEQLSDFLLEVMKIMDRTEKKELIQTINSIWLEVEQGPHFHFEIAKLRAIRLLWRFFLSHYTQEDKPLPIIAEVGGSLDQKDPYRNMIAYTSSVLYAMVGGADIIKIAPLGSEGAELSENFQRRIARNIPMIAQLESYISKVEDPVAGSYVFEKMSQDLSHLSWKIFLEKAGSLNANSG